MKKDEVNYFLMFLIQFNVCRILNFTTDKINGYSKKAAILPTWVARDPTGFFSKISITVSSLKYFQDCKCEMREK